MTILLGFVPETVNVVTCCVVPVVNNMEWAPVPSSLKSANVLLPLIVRDAVLAPLENHTLL